MVRRLTELGAAVNAAAHDIHGLLEDIQEHAVGTLDDANGGAPAREAMERVRLAAEAGSALVRRLSRGGPLAQGGPLDLNAAVKAVLDLYMLVVPARVRVVTRLQPGAWPARITQEGLEHILAFLLVQSRDALPAGGTITVATENVTADEPACGVPSPPMAGDHVCLTVSHAGPAGSGPADCGLFEPLVGPCEARDAARFGLSVIAELVRHQGGRLSVGPLPTQGTALKVCLPALRGHET